MDEPARSPPTLVEQESDFTAEGDPAPGVVSASASAASDSHSDFDQRGGPSRGSAALAAHTLPTSFGVVKPVGYVMIGLPTQAQPDALVAALHGARWSSASMLHFSPTEGVPELKTMVDSAGAAAGCGCEITLLRRYLALPQEGYRWLLVKVDHGDHAPVASEVAPARGAAVGVCYRTLTVEDLIP